MEKYYKISGGLLECLIADSMKAEALNLTETEMNEDYPIEKREYYDSLIGLYFTQEEVDGRVTDLVPFNELARREIELFPGLYEPINPVS